MQDRFARYRELVVAHDHVALEGDAVVLHSEPPSLLPSDALEVLDITSCTPVIILGCILGMRRGVDRTGCNAKYVRFTRFTV